MEYLSAKDVAGLWGTTPRRVQMLCAAGRVEGAVRLGRAWLIPEGISRPIDGRSSEARQGERSESMPLPRKTPFLYMTDLYSTPGTADSVSLALAKNHEAQVLFDAEVAYSRGEIDKVYDRASYLLGKHSGFYAVLSAGMLLALCAIWRGDLDLWRRAKLHIAEAPAKTDMDRDIMTLAITAADSMLYDVSGFPEWFKIGNFEPLPPDALPATKVYYTKYLYASAYSVATGEVELDGVKGLSLMKLLPLTVEPMISQAVADGSLISEIYLRMICASIYHNAGNDKEAIRHLDKAIPLCLADGLLGLFAEYCRPLDSLLERRISLVDEEAWQRVKRLSKIYTEGWSALSQRVRGRQIITSLTTKEREVAKLAAFGLSNPQIAAKLGMSISVVKQAIRITSEKSGMRRDEFAAIL